MFDFEKLDVYRLALEFYSDIAKLIDKLPKNEYAIIDQLKRAALSIPLNIAEGSGRTHDNEKRQFTFIARGSAFECVPILSLLERQNAVNQEVHAALREKLIRLVQMLTKLGQSFSRDRET
ncbi:MAG: four helix bundle protein [Deltaproteobacteria bacterium]|nr:four helix bundle protein [Deltaproteobacteria bacterium]